jgi:hypothetical protein
MEIKLSYIFSRNQKIGSRAIAWSSGLIIKDLEKVPSHMALLIEIPEWPEAFVLESVLETGVRIVPYSKWLGINEECYKVPCKQKRSLQEIIAYMHEYWGRKYDWLGIAYFAWRFFLNLVFKRDFPKENAWQSDDKYFCNELGGEIAGYAKYSMVTPAKMCSDFLKI